MNKRVHEFCNFNAEWPFRQLRKRFRSSQNAALLQYRIPHHGSFVASVKFIENPERMYNIQNKNHFPQQNQFQSRLKNSIVLALVLACNILVEGSTPFYSLSNHGAKRNCTLTSMTPSVVTLRAINIGAEHQTANYDVSCFISSFRLFLCVGGNTLYK